MTGHARSAPATCGTRGRRSGGVAMVPALAAGVLVGLLLLAPGLAPGLDAQQQARLFISVMDADGFPSTDLLADEFHITWGDAESDILSARLANEPMKVTVLVDNSDAVNDGMLRNIRDGLKVFVDSLPRGHEVAIVALARQPKWVVPHTADYDELRSGVDLIIPERDAGSAFLDALGEAGERFGGDQEPKREVIVAITTNMGESSGRNETDYNQLVRLVRGHSATVHALLLQQRVAPSGLSRPQPGLREHVDGDSERFNRLGPERDRGLQTDIAMNLTEVSGGRYTSLAAASGLSVQLESLADEIARRQAELAGQYRVVVTRPATLDANSPLRVSVERPDVSIRITPDGRLQ